MDSFKSASKKYTLFAFISLFFLNQAFCYDLLSSSDTVRSSSVNAASSGATKASVQALSASAADLTDPRLALSNDEYPVTAGDVYTLAFVASKTPVSYTLTIDPDYSVRVANLGIIKDCEGLTYRALKKQVVELVGKNFPLSAVQFVLTSPAVFMVSLTGDVDKSCEYKAWALSRLSSILKGHLLDCSSVRNVRVVSSSGKANVYDLFEAVRNGDFSNDPYLRPGDRIEVPHAKRQVTVQGEVERPGKYELLDGENLKALVEKYGDGLTPTADTSKISLFRTYKKENSGETEYIPAESIEKDLALENFDVINIRSYLEIKPGIFVTGAINLGTEGDTSLEGMSKLSVRFNDGMLYYDLVRQNLNLFSPLSDLENAYIIREVSDSGEEVRIPINLSKILFDSSFRSTEQVKNGDTLLIPFKQFFVTVSGAVPSPGRYPYIPDRDVNYYIGLAGGIDSYRNSFKKITVVGLDGKKLDANSPVVPECNIQVEENSGWYKWTRVSGGVTAILSAISTVISILAVTGVFGN